MVLIDSGITLDTYEVVADTEVSVEVGSTDTYLGILGEATCCTLDDSEGLRMDLIQSLLELLEDLLLYLIYLTPDSLTLV
jgi:hypothetical protein